MLHKKIEILKEDIFKYDDITDYLKAWYKKNKNKEFHFSYRYLQKKLNYRSSATAYWIIAKGRYLTGQKMNKLIEIMGLSEDEKDYFIVLTHLSKIKIDKRLKRELTKGYRYIKMKQNKKR